MTEYVVLKENSDPLPEDLQNYEFNPRGFHVVHTVEARSATAAVRDWLKDGETEGTFVAVPARSWKPVTVKVETKTALKFS
jgi:hypothetical protein